jgi:hypothetical protein
VHYITQHILLRTSDSTFNAVAFSHTAFGLRICLLLPALPASQCRHSNGLAFFIQGVPLLLWNGTRNSRKLFLVYLTAVHLLHRTKIYDRATSNRVIPDSELWKIWKEVILPRCKKCPQGFLRRMEETYEIISHDYLPPGRDSEWGSTKHMNKC